jgi:hypothetical protein
MRNRLFILIGFYALISLTSCASAKQNAWLKAHQTELNRVAQSNVPSEEKMDVLLTQYAVLMDEGMQFVNPVKGVKYIQKFQKLNDPVITKIVGESGNWVSNLNTGEGLMLGLRVSKKPYINKYIDLVPKFHRKYEQYKFVANMTGKVVGGFGKLGGKILSL